MFLQVAFVWLLFLTTRAFVVFSSPLNNTTVPQCFTAEDCGSQEVCVNLTCVNPCVNRCGNNTLCLVVDHVAVCSCSFGYSGHPLATSGCLPTNNSQRKTKIFYPEGTFKLNWFEAFMYCRSKGQQLADIQTKQENDQFLQEIKKTQGYQDNNSYLFWTAGTDLANEGVWYWMTSGLPMNGFTDWHQHQPDNFEDREHCLAFGDRGSNKWYDADCKKVETYFVCQDYE